MANQYRLQRVYLIVLLCAVIGVIFAVRCYNRELSGDELLYQYVWEEDDPTWLWSMDHRFERKVSSWADIWQTQVRHYFEVNGRSVVHTIEQAFTGHLLAFSIVNTCVFLLFVWLIVCYVAPKSKRDSFALWLSVFMVLLLLFPYQESLWISVNYGLNYLWPATMAVAVLILWDKISSGRLPRKYDAAVAILAFVFGWTHEGFVVGVAGGMFLYYCFNFKAMRGQILYLVIPMWVSAAIMLLSPGNFLRFFGQGDESSPRIMGRLLMGISDSFMCPVSMTLIIMIIVMLAAGRREMVKKFLKDNIKTVLCFCITFVFILFANTRLYSHCFVELTALLLIWKFVCRQNRRMPKWTKILSAVVALLFIAQQTVVARDTIMLCKYHHQKVREYIEAPDEIISYSTDFISPLSRPFVRIWGGTDKTYHSLHVYKPGRNWPTLLKDADMTAVKNPDRFFVPENKVEGNAPVYYGKGGNYYWVKSSELPEGRTIEADLYPVDWKRDDVSFLIRMNFMLFPGKYEKTMSLRIDTLETISGQAYKIDIPEIRRIKAVNLR